MAQRLATCDLQLRLSELLKRPKAEAYYEEISSFEYSRWQTNLILTKTLRTQITPTTICCSGLVVSTLDHRGDKLRYDCLRSMQLPVMAV